MKTVPGRAPLTRSLMTFFLGKIITAGTYVAAALMQAIVVTRGPLSAEVITPICHFPFSATTFGILL
jgi:hypothetical protein